MPRNFNTTGPCDPVDHYMLSPEQRAPDLLPLIQEKLYFVVHAARQTGKTTAMRAFAERLRTLGYVAVWATLEESQGMIEVDDAEPLWLVALERAAEDQLAHDLQPPNPSRWQRRASGSRLHQWLRAWSKQVAPAPMVLLLDEADVVSGPALVSLLRQLRAGFMDRGPGRFPVSVGLIGMRDLRDYLTQAKDGTPVNPGSPFNVKSSSITLRNFNQDEIQALYQQHTDDTGQVFTPDAVARAWYWTQGQPFLVNALARIAVKDLVPDPTQPVTEAIIDQAKEQLILSRTTHLDALAERLREPRVAPIVQAVVTGDTPRAIPYGHDDFQYVLDLGLIRMGPDGAEPANPLYREVLARQITYPLQMSLTRPRWRWQTADGRLDFPALVVAFLSWWRECADALVEDMPLYPEAVPHIAFMAFLQRVVNGGGQVTREYAAGRGAVDVVVTYGPDRYVVELKRVRPRDSLERVRAAGTEQLLGYLATLGADEGWLLLFDQRPGLSWDARLWAEDVTIDGRILRLRGA